MNTLSHVLFINHSIRDGGPGKSLFYILKYLDRTKITPYVLIPKDEVFSERLKVEGIYENIILDKRFPENLKRPRFGKSFQEEGGNGATSYYNGLLKFISVMLNILDMLSLIVTSPLLLRRNNIKLIYCNGTQAKVVGALIGLVNWCPVIWHVRNIQQTKLLGSIINTLSRLPVVRRIICVSGPTARPFNKVKEKVRVIHNGVDIEDYSPNIVKGELRAKYEISETTIVVGSTGRIVPRKGYDLFINSAKTVIDELGKGPKDVKFVIVGDTPYFFQDDHLSFLKNIVSQNGLDDYFIFTGYKKEVRTYLKDFDIFVIPSNYPDPFPRTVIEAMSFELPIIGFKAAGGIVESVDDGVTGILNDSGSTEDMGRAILKLIEDPTLRKSMGVAGRKRVKDNFQAIERTKDIQKNILEVLGLA
ncbi:MAG: glycosyltransferase family 4 protein [Candidatus Dadabacteria bacterium]|nr:glycosyltransferase family 4 protein [Candidatus Dadabacteria bacterium]